ncbi:coenzyme F420-reducing hydrogenase, alpha subunit [Candidatus Methanoperedens nitroreducens]|uniref:Coenzyme F420-reducing hydrogenase, alpha subunit n=1 Tax=Candidatus Methanoperedens nitratireducens TaxID=1392998 RepID=A0A062V8U4_9EURY|nr:Ni/Fe hydrogenase subunit alpha [Candidatus Methanoperedens nitroreducens]KCZ71790.1 coenzyme F420-reducing hydrogenase, alpha subunit [Candidatus Methanoperedens nitroreducens]MDJ1422236.1 Ni/Fe hydrogenase subunit alpha [Candidatus Methanoperedens sp.]
MTGNSNNTDSRDIKVDIHYLTRVEGHGNIVVDVKEGKLTRCEFQVIESPRFFESMLVDRCIWEAQHLTSRICGICACAHSLASIKAAEDALGIKPSEEVISLRKLLLHTEMMDSHILHVYFLVVPDLLGVKSVMQLIKTHKPLVEMALRMKRMSDYAGEVLAGRHIHPISYVIGGLTQMPSKKGLEKLYKLMLEARRDGDETVKIIKALKFPEFNRPTQYMSLTSEEEYAFYDGDLIINGGRRTKIRDYKKLLTEKVLDYSTAKISTIDNKPYTVGAISRFNNNYDKLNKKAKEVAKELGLKPPCHNPYLNTAIQLVEWVHCLEESIKMMEKILKNGLKEEKIVVASWPKRSQINTLKFMPDTGTGCVEAPRGSLFHQYSIDDTAHITAADCVIPTNQNIGNLEEDMRKIVPELLGTHTQEQITLDLEMLARAYDPCISCATHVLDVKFVNA